MRLTSNQVARNTLQDAPLDTILKALRITGAACFEIAAHEPWSLHSGTRELIRSRLLPGADHLIAYHLVTAGRCFASFEGGEVVSLQAGEAVVFTNAVPHTISSTAGTRAAPMIDIISVADAGVLPFQINPVNSGASARLVCGYLAYDAKPFNPVLQALPAMLKADDSGRNNRGWLGQFIHFAMTEVAEKRPGRQSILTRFGELMFMDVVRRYFETVPPQDAGWLAALQDPIVGNALALIHARPSFDWTIDDLASRSGVSRTIMAERFVRSVGLPPIQYLARRRMQVASEMLDRGNCKIATIAVDVGYQSEAAFSRAFKRMMGISPSIWRQGLR